MVDCGTYYLTRKEKIGNFLRILWELFPSQLFLYYYRNRSHNGTGIIIIPVPYTHLEGGREGGGEM